MDIGSLVWCSVVPNVVIWGVGCMVQGFGALMFSLSCRLRGSVQGADKERVLYRV